MRQSEDHLVRIAVNREMLEGDLNVPSGTPRVVVFAHGSGSSRHSPRNRHIAQMLRQSGLATLLLISSHLEKSKLTCALDIFALISVC